MKMFEFVLDQEINVLKKVQSIKEIDNLDLFACKVDKNKNIFCLDNSKNLILKIDPYENITIFVDKQKLIEWVTELDYISDFIIDTDGSLYLLDFRKKIILKCSNEGNLVFQYVLNILDTLLQVMIDQQHNIVLILERNEHIVIEHHPLNGTQNPSILNMPVEKRLSELIIRTDNENNIYCAQDRLPYKIIKFDLQGNIVAIFSRDSIEFRDIVTFEKTTSGLEEIGYCPIISDLAYMPQKELLIVLLSESSEDNKYLLDLFDRNSKYIGQFSFGEYIGHSHIYIDDDANILFISSSCFPSSPHAKIFKGRLLDPSE